MIKLENHHFYQCVEVEDFLPKSAHEATLRNCQDEMRHRLAEFLIEKKAKEKKIPGTTYLRMDLMVFDEEEFTLLMLDLEQKFALKQRL